MVIAHRLSALVAKCFHQALDFIPVDDRKIAETLSWLINIQALNGSFSEPPDGRVLHRDMQVFLSIECNNCINSWLDSILVLSSHLNAVGSQRRVLILNVNSRDQSMCQK